MKNPASTHIRENRRVLFLAILVFAATLVCHAAEAPRLLPFQGRLTDQSGVGVSNGVRLVQFKIFEVPSGGSPVWAGELHRTTVNGGLVNVLLGSKTPFTGVDFDRQLYLDITVDINVDNAITAADPPMLPRQAILPVIFATEAADTRKLAGHDWSALLDSTNAVTGYLSGARILSNSITGAQIGDNQILDRHIGTISRLSAPDGEPAHALSVDNSGNVAIGTNQPRSRLHVVGAVSASSLNLLNGVTANGPEVGEFTYVGGYREGTFQNFLGSGSDASCLRMLGMGDRAGGYGMAVGGNIFSPIIWFYGDENRNCFQIRAVDFDVNQARAEGVPDGTPLLTVMRIGGGARVGIGIQNAASALDIAGQGRATSGFVNSCDRATKRDFKAVDSSEILNRVSTLPIHSWTYKADEKPSRHIGPVAQDFHAAFQLGEDDKHISTIDADGVALSAIQGLHKLVQQKDAEIQALKTALEALTRKVDAIGAGR